MGEASSVEAQPDRISIFVYPNRVIADGNEKSKIIVVAKKDQKSMSGVTITFEPSMGKLSNTKQVTDSQGQAVTYISSNTAGEAKIVAKTDGLSKEETVTFFYQR